MLDNLRIIPIGMHHSYRNLVQALGLESLFNCLTDAEISTTTFSFYTSVASVFSSKIEGEDIDLDSYIKHKK